MQVDDVFLKELRISCIRNAKDLLVEASLLFQQKKYSRSAFLAITSYEESLKAGLVSSYRYEHLSKTQFKKIWRNHDLKMLTKYAHVAVYEHLKTGRIIQRLKFPEHKDKVTKIIQERMNSLYVDIKKDEILEPKIIRNQQAQKYIRVAKRNIYWEEMFQSIEKELEDENNREKEMAGIK